MMKSLCFLLLFWIAACQPVQERQSIRVSLVADGRERTFAYDTPVTVDEFLRDPKVDIQLGELDDVNPPRYTQITDGMRVTVVRVTEEEQCVETEIPFRQRTIQNEALQPGEEQVSQPGQNGRMQICYRVTFRDGVESNRAETRRNELVAARDEIVSVGPVGEIEPVSVVGTLAYLNNGNAWLIRGSSTSKRLLTTTSDLDGRVFSLSPDGSQLLFTRTASSVDDTAVFNQLWVIPSVIREVEPVSLIPDNILYADWIPGQPNTIAYSTAEVQEAAPGWKALNDLWQMRIDPATGTSLNLEQIVEGSQFGFYSWWGTRFEWSPDGQQVAWVRADSVGLVDLESGALGSPLLDYAVFSTTGAAWSWRATVSWSPDGDLVLTTVHGAPVGREAPENSPAFDVAVADVSGAFSSVVFQRAGIWAAPQYSPFVPLPDQEFPQGYLAYLRARDPFNSINGEYDLVVADRDGSNARVIFPGSDKPGVTAQQSIYQNQEFAWSADGRQIALVYQGNLWMVDVESAVAHQLTLDGGASNPVWTS